MYCSHVAYCTTLSCSNSHHQSSPQEILVAKGGTMWARNARWILPEMPDWSFTCRKSTTWNRRLYFPSEGRRAEDFFALEYPTVSAGFEPANLGTKGQHATSRPPKPLISGVACIDVDAKVWKLVREKHTDIVGYGHIHTDIVG